MNNKEVTLKERVKGLIDDMGTNGADTVGITDEMVEHINQSENGVSWRLKLTHSSITPLAFKALLAKFSNVTEIDFTGTRIPANSFSDLINFISTNTSLKTVSLEDCGFSPEELIRIAHAVKPSLESFDISNNSLLTTRGKVTPNESHLISIVRILKDKDIIIRMAQPAEIPSGTSRYLALNERAKGMVCKVAVKRPDMSVSEERGYIARIEYLNKLAMKYSNLEIEPAKRHLLSVADFQVLGMPGSSQIFTAALMVMAGMSRDQANGVSSSVRAQFSKLNPEVSAGIAFASKVASECEKGARWSYISSEKIGLSLQGFNKLAKCEGLVRNALRMQHGFTEENVEGQIKELKRQAADVLKAVQQQKAEADKQKAEKKGQAQSHVKRSGNASKAPGASGKHTEISRNR